MKVHYFRNSGQNLQRRFADSFLGKTKDGESVSGTITIPEVAHDTEEDEYVVCALHPVHVYFSDRTEMLTRNFFHEQLV